MLLIYQVVSIYQNGSLLLTIYKTSKVPEGEVVDGSSIERRIDLNGMYNLKKQIRNE